MRAFLKELEHSPHFDLQLKKSQVRGALPRDATPGFAEWEIKAAPLVSSIKAITQQDFWEKEFLRMLQWHLPDAKYQFKVEQNTGETKPTLILRVTQILRFRIQWPGLKKLAREKGIAIHDEP